MDRGVKSRADPALIGVLIYEGVEPIDIGVTGGGVSLAIDATLYLLGRLYGEDAAQEIARVTEYDRAYAANRAALGIVDHAEV